ncbi:hypothetical protein MRY87_08390, partial [bacterium]|nr:hypothetical protein [bacterium]
RFQGHRALAKKLDGVTDPTERLKITADYFSHIEGVREFQAWGQVATQLIALEDPKMAGIVSAAIQVTASAALASTGDPVSIANLASASITLVSSIFGGGDSQGEALQKAFQGLFDAIRSLEKHVLELRKELREFRREMHDRLDIQQDMLVEVLKRTSAILDGQRTLGRGQREILTQGERTIRTINNFLEAYQNDQSAERAREVYDLSASFREAQDERVDPFILEEEQEALIRQDALTFLHYALHTAAHPLLTGADRDLDNLSMIFTALYGRPSAETYGLLERGTAQLLQIPEAERLAALVGATPEDSLILQEVSGYRLAAIHPDAYAAGVAAFLNSPLQADQRYHPRIRERIEDMIELGELHQRLAAFLGSPAVLQKAFKLADDELSNAIAAFKTAAHSPQLNDALEEQGAVDLTEGIEQFFRSRIKQPLAEAYQYDRGQNLTDQRVSIDRRQAREKFKIDPRIFNDFSRETRVATSLHGASNPRAGEFRRSVEIDHVIGKMNDVKNGARTTSVEKVYVGTVKTPIGGRNGFREEKVYNDVHHWQQNYLRQTASRAHVVLFIGEDRAILLDLEGEQRTIGSFACSDRASSTPKRDDRTRINDVHSFEKAVPNDFNTCMAPAAEQVIYAVQDLLRQHAPDRNLRAIRATFSPAAPSQLSDRFAPHQISTHACQLDTIVLEFELSDEEAREQGRLLSKHVTTSEIEEKLVGELFPGNLVNLEMKWLPSDTPGENGSETDQLLEPYREYLHDRSIAAPAEVREILKRSGGTLAEALVRCDEAAVFYKLYEQLGVPREALQMWRLDQATAENPEWDKVTEGGEVFSELFQTRVRKILEGVITEEQPLKEFILQLEALQKEEQSRFAAFLRSWESASTDIPTEQYGATAVQEALSRLRQAREELMR